MSKILVLQFRGEKVEVSVGSLDSLLSEICVRFTLSRESLKLICKGKLIKTEDDFSALPEKSALFVTGSTSADVTAVQTARDLPGLASIEHEELRELRRHAAAAGLSTSKPTPSSSSPYTFLDYRALPLGQISSKLIRPSSGEALALLKRLGTDPGIQHLMDKHQWKVGALTEMPPRGKVGVSPVCILGVNINQGQEISLRLRTDDLRGFRKYDRIKETLVHELAHMRFSEHDVNFKTFNSQLLRDAAAGDWTAAATRSMMGGLETFSPQISDEQMQAVRLGLDPKAQLMHETAKSSGQRLGHGPGDTGAGVQRTVRDDEDDHEDVDQQTLEDEDAFRLLGQ